MTDSANLAPILIADDDADVARLVREILEDEGYRTVVAPSHPEALAALAAARYALILADTGGAVRSDADPAHRRSMQEVLDGAGKTPVVIISAHPPSAFAVHRERGFAGLITKPFDLDALVATVRGLVGPGHNA